MNNDSLQTTASGVVAGEKSLAAAPTSKKIGFISAISIVMGSSIGAGIFFKSSAILEYSGSNLFWAILSWLVAGFAVICMALALIEIASARNDNLGMIGWCKTFNGKYIYKGCKYFMTFVYLPLTFFFMPLYVLLSMQDALTGFEVNNNFNTANDWAIWMVIALFISVYFIIVAGLSSRAANIQNWIITSLKFIPLAVVAILGFVLAFMPVDSNGETIGGINNTGDIEWFDKNATDFFAMSPAFGIFGSIAAIFFAYDGFYVTAGLQTEMREPRKTPKAIFVGLVLVTAIYLIIAISMSLGSPGGSFFSFQDWLKANNAQWVFGVVNVLIAVGVLGIINGFAVWSSRFIEDLIKEGELVVPRRSLKLLKKNQPILGTIYTLALSVPIIIIFCAIGGLGYFPGAYSDAGQSLYDGTGFSSQAKLLNFADLMATWSSLFAFGFIAFAILGGLMNRKTNRVKTERNKYFVWTGWVSFIIVGLSLVFSIAHPFINIGLLINAKVDVSNDEFIGNILLCVLLFLFALVSFGPVALEEKMAHRRLKKLDAIQKAVFAREKIVISAQKAIISGNTNELKRILIHEFYVEEAYIDYALRLPWNMLVKNHDNYLLAQSYGLNKYMIPIKGEELFIHNVVEPLNEQIRLTRLCIDSCKTPHWYFAKNKPNHLAL